MERVKRYDCPEDFTSVSYVPCGSARGQNVFDETKELWLIKAPANFDPRSLSGKKLPLEGLKTLQTGKAGAAQQVFSVLGRRSTATDFRLLTNDPNKADAHLCAPAFSGVLNVSESYGDCSSNQGPQAIPAAPAPQLPDGLRQRFFPFGSGRAAEEASVPAGLVTAEADGGGKPRKRKKDKGKEGKKRIKVEEEEEAAAVVVKMEQLSQTIAEQSTTDGQVTEERKKKKKKKDKEREKVEAVDTCVIKEEPLDRDYVDSEPVHTKKKKKKTKTVD